MKKKITSLFREVSKRKKIIFVIMYLIILPIVVLTILYSARYIKNAPNLFDDEKAEITSVKKLEGVHFEFYATKIQEQVLEDDGTLGNGKTKYTFAAKCYPKEKKTIEGVVTINVIMGSHWDSYQTNSTNRTISNFSSTTATSLSAITIDKKLPIKVLPFVKIKNLTAYVKIQYKLKNDDNQYLYYLKFTPNDYITTVTVFA